MAKLALEQAMSNNMTKYEGHSLYLELMIRMAEELTQDGYNGDRFFEEIIHYIENCIQLLTPETRYKFYL